MPHTILERSKSKTKGPHWQRGDNTCMHSKERVGASHKALTCALDWGCPCTARTPRMEKPCLQTWPKAKQVHLQSFCSKGQGRTLWSILLSVLGEKSLPWEKPFFILFYLLSFNAAILESADITGERLSYLLVPQSFWLLAFLETMVMPLSSPWKFP